MKHQHSTRHERLSEALADARDNRKSGYLYLFVKSGSTVQSGTITMTRGRAAAALFAGKSGRAAVDALFTLPVTKAIFTPAKLEPGILPDASLTMELLLRRAAAGKAPDTPPHAAPTAGEPAARPFLERCLDVMTADLGELVVRKGSPSQYVGERCDVV